MKLRIKVKKIGKKVWGKEEVEHIIEDLTKKGYLASQIGEILRREYGIHEIKKILGVKLAEYLKIKGFYPPLPEDLLFLMKRAIRVREHLAKHKKDLHSKRGLQLIESKIRSLAKYYKRKGILPKDWNYDPEKAKLLVRRYVGKT